MDADAQLRGFRRAVITTAVSLFRSFREKLGAIFHQYVSLLLLTVADVSDIHFIPWLHRRDNPHQFVATLDWLAVHGRDRVASLESSFLARLAGHNFRNGHAVLDAIHARQSRTGRRVELHADRAARHAVLWTRQLLIYFAYGIRRHGEPHALVSKRLRVNRGIDADHFAVHVHQWATGVAGIDGGVCLNERLELTTGVDIAPDSGNDARGHRVFQTEWAAYSQHPIAHGHALRVAQPGRLEGPVLGRLNFDHRQVGLTVAADDFGVMQLARRIVFDPHPDPVGAFHHMTIGDDVAVGIQDHARAERPVATAALAIKGILVIVRVLSEVAVKEILEWILALVGTGGTAARLAIGFRADVHDCRLDLFSHLAERVAQLLRRLHRQQGGFRCLAGATLH